nr:polysaccharide biosynthesis protein GumK [Acetobacter conturbans]
MTEELAKRGRTRFYSVGMSRLSEHRGDTRMDLVDRANHVEIIDGVECYLQRNLWHPFRLKNRKLRFAEEGMFQIYTRLMTPVLRKWIREADQVFIESGMAAVYIGVVKKLNPKARIVYWAADDLTTIGAAETIQRSFIRNFESIDTIRLPSRLLLEGMPHGKTAILAPHGINKAVMDTPRPSPMTGERKTCVSVGSMLFDASFFNIAAPLFPNLDFYVIGAGPAASGVTKRQNIIIHDEMPFEETLGWLAHMTIGVAPYRDNDTPAYLLDTSMKLRQFAYFGKPAVCPQFAVGGMPSRFGYKPGDPTSIKAAITAALLYKDPVSVDIPEWSEIAERVLHPDQFPEWRLEKQS